MLNKLTPSINKCYIIILCSLMIRRFSSSSLESSLKAKLVGGGVSLSRQLSKIDPEFYEYLRENDSGLLEEMAADSSSDGDSGNDGEAELKQTNQSSSDDDYDDDDDLGTVEPRPLYITSRKEVSRS